MAQSATRTSAEPDKDETTSANENTGQDPTETDTNEEFRDCESIITGKGETFTKWWTTQFTSSAQNNAKRGWTTDDFSVLRLIQGAYESSTKTEPWGCLCNESSYWENHNRRTRRSKTGKDNNNATPTRSKTSNCANEMVSQTNVGQAFQPARIDHNQTCEGETLKKHHMCDMVRYHF